jgi:SAM-dependent methyltransferase
MATLTRIHRASPDLSGRSTESEWLDDAGVDPAELERVLRDLARFNGAILGRRVIISWLRRAIDEAPHGKPLTLVDVGCGNGDLLRAIRRWTRRRGVPMKLFGLDLNEESVRIAGATTHQADQIDYQVGDVFDFQSNTAIDIVVSSLLTHHLSDQLIVEFLRWMERTARKGWLIYDLQRHFVPYHLVGAAGALLRLHPTVVHDGRISVARSLTRGEWDARLTAAGIPRDAVDLRWFLFRFVIGRMR